MYVFHEGFNDRFMDFQGSKFLNAVFVDSPSHSGRDGDKGICLPSFILYGVPSYLSCLCVRAWSGDP